MSIVVREADLIGERQILVEILNENLPKLRHDLRFEWLYYRNPHGRARAWLALDGRTGRVVGTASVFPRLLRLGGETVVCGQVGDFAIKAEFRSLGPAILLQKATLDPIRTGQMILCYDTPPDERGMATFKRMGIAPLGRTVRFAKPLKVDRKLRTLVKNEAITRRLSAVGNLFLMLRDRRETPSLGTAQIAGHHGRFDDEFSELDRRLATRHKVYCPRDEEYLNWRYRDDPLNQHEVLTARRQGRLLAYAVFNVKGNDAYLMDAFGDELAVRSLLVQTAQILRKRSVEIFHVTLLEGGGLVPALKNAGFHFRDEGYLVASCDHLSKAMRTLVYQTNNWYMISGDITL